MKAVMRRPAGANLEYSVPLPEVDAQSPPATTAWNREPRGPPRKGPKDMKELDAWPSSLCKVVFGPSNGDDEVALFRK